MSDAPDTVALVDQLLSRLRAHGFLAQRIELPGVLILDLAAAPAELLTPGEQDMRTPERGERGLRVLGLPNRGA